MLGLHNREAFLAVERREIEITRRNHLNHRHALPVYRDPIVAVANNPNRQPFNGEALLTKVNDNWFKLAIFWQQFDFIALFFQALNGNFVINTCDNDLTVTYILSLLHCHQVIPVASEGVLL